MKSGVSITCCLLLLCGCTQTNWRQSLVRPAPRDTEQIAARERAMVEKFIDETTQRSKSTVPLLRAQNPDHPRIAVSSSSGTRRPLISHDAGTWDLIDRETRDLDHEDRERAIAALEAIPSESVPAVLQLWKAGLNSQFGRPASPGNLSSQEPMAADRGLGQTSPWPGANTHETRSGPRGWDSQPPASNRFSQDIARVHSPSYGYSSPFTDGLGRIDGDEGFEEASNVGPVIMSRNQSATDASTASSPRSARVALDRQSAPQQNTSFSWEDQAGSLDAESRRQPFIPREWPSASQQPSLSRESLQAELAELQGELDRLANNGKAAGRQAAQSMQDDFGNAKPNGQSEPRDLPHRRLQVRNSVYARPSQHASPARGLKLRERPSEPLIRPQANADAGALPASARSEIQRTGYSAPSHDQVREEIPLVPGQTLPGFEQGMERVQQLAYERQNATRSRNLPQQPLPREVVPGAYREDRDHTASSSGPAVQRTSSTDKALRFLVQATETEVNQLKPGRSAAELQYYIERHVYLRLLYLMSGQNEWALRPIPNVPAADQEFWTQVLWGVQNYFDLPHIPDHAERASQTIAQFNTAMLRLKERAPLEMKNVTFCCKIEGYGEYDTYSKNEFSPGERVLVYAEIGNFHSELSAEGIYRTRLKSTLQIVAAEAPQEPIDVKVYPVTEDYCRNHRRDYFHSYVVEIPVRCERGAHNLKLIVEDEQSGKVAVHSMPFVVR